MQRIEGIILHHSVCPTINGKGYDFWIGRESAIIPASLETDPHFIHICLEGDFSAPLDTDSPQITQQLFACFKLVMDLSKRYGFPTEDVWAHQFHCPGPYFPWDKLVISPKDGYH